MRHRTATDLIYKSSQVINGSVGRLIPTLSAFASSAKLTGWPLLILIVSIALLIRLHSLAYISESLWNEDGVLFINDSYALGVNSLWAPSVWYQSLYERIVALVASQAPLIMVPYIFFFGWLLAFFSIVGVIKSRARGAGLDDISVLYLIALIALQPSQGEAWFNLIHSCFFLGIAFAFYVCVPLKKVESIPEILFVLIASLTGPFSIVMTVILAFELITLRDFSARKMTYTIVPTCAAVQAIFIFSSHRVQQTGFYGNAESWLHAMMMFFFFGKTTGVMYTIAALFWIVTLIYFVKWIFNRETRVDRVMWLSPVFAAVTAAVMFLFGALSEGNFLSRLSPLDMESRYFLVPYSLVFFVALVCTKEKKKVQAAIACLGGLICAVTFLPVDGADRGSTTGLLAHANMQWNAFAKFQKIKPDIVIPINSPVPTYPPYNYIQIKGSGGENRDRYDKKRGPIQLTPTTSSATGKYKYFEQAKVADGSTAESPALLFDVREYCARSNYLALEIDMWRARMGMARLYWGRRGTDVNVGKSLERFYPAGAVTAQFAFRRDLVDDMISLYPALGVPQSAIVRTLAKIKPYFKDSQYTFAEQTEPGGEVKISAVRLFCLD